MTVDVIATAGGKLWKELVGVQTGPIKITNVSLGFTGIETTDESQQSIDVFFANSSGTKRPRADSNDLSHKRPERETDDAEIALTHSSSDTGRHATSFTCLECHKTFSLSAKLLSTTTDSKDRAQALEAMRNEHTDFHFAQLVAREVEPVIDRSGTSSTTNGGKVRPSKKQKKGTGPKGIEKFFNRT